MNFIPNFSKKGRKAGFSLVELMIVVGIIGILASLAVPRFQKFQAKARQAEAKNNLSHIYTLEMSFHADYDQYAKFKYWVPKSSIFNKQASEVQRLRSGGTADVKKELFEGDACKDDQIGFSLNPCYKARYQYRVTKADVESFTGIARSGQKKSNKVVPGCRFRDIWQVDERKRIKNTTNAVVKCDG